MEISNFEEKGLLEHDGGYITEDMKFFVNPSIFTDGKWAITPVNPEMALSIGTKVFEGTENEVLNKLKEWQ